MAESGHICRRSAFSVIEAVDWFRTESGRDTFKVLSGIRGAGKTAVVDLYRTDLMNRGVRPEEIIRFDFEDRRMRHVRNSRELLALLPGERKGKRRLYLILDEITCLVDFEKLMGLLYLRSDLDLFVTISNRRLMTDSVKGYFESRLSECRLFPGPGLERTPDKLDGIWAAILLRDVLGGHVLADAAAIEQLCGYLSDRLCEPLSKRVVAAEFKIGGDALSANTVGSYLELLANAYLVEFVPSYDVFAGAVSKNTAKRMFCIEPVLRAHRFGPAPEGEDERSAYNARYLELRREYGSVLCCNDGKRYSDFVVFPGKRAEIVKWEEQRSGGMVKVPTGSHKAKKL